MCTADRLKQNGLIRVLGCGHGIIGEEHNEETDYILPRINFNKRFRVSIPNRAYWEARNGDPEGVTNIYTDGSKSDDGVGAAVLCQELNAHASFKLPDEWLFKKLRR